MRVKVWLTFLCATLCCISGYAQEHYATPRKEIRHLVMADGSQTQAQIPNSMQRASGEYIMTEFPTTGDIKGIVILAAFSDVPFSTDSVSINELLSNRFNAENYTEDVSFEEYSKIYAQTLSLNVTIPGSARDYYRTQSFGKFVPSFDVIGPITLDKQRSYYGGNNSSGNDKNTDGMIREACQKAYDMGLTDFKDYDNDGDGVVDFVYVVYAGSDEAQTQIKDAVWAKASQISLTLGEMKIRRYACSGELVIDLPVVAGIGTFVHEFSHVLGLPDFYNTINSKSEKLSMDVWSVMDYGLYNAEGFVPCGYTAFERYSLGWIPIKNLDTPSAMNIGTTDEEGVGYRIFTSEIDSTTLVTEADTASFFLVETIRKEGWNRYAPANGLLISQVTYKASAWQNNKVNTETAYRHYIVPANNHWSIINGYNPRLHLFGTQNHEFTTTSMPSSITQFGAAMDKPLTEINYDAITGRTSFYFCGGTGIEEPTDMNHGTKPQYDLWGRPIKDRTEGLYIQDGKTHLRP